MNIKFLDCLVFGGPAIIAFGFISLLQRNKLIYLELIDCQVSGNGDYGSILEAILDSCYSLQKLSFGTTSYGHNMPLNLSIFYRVCLQNGKSLKTLYMPNCKGLDMKLLKMIVNYCESLIEVDFSSEISNGLSEESIDFLFENLSSDIEQLFFRGQSFYNEFNITRLINRCTKLRKLDIGTY